MAPPGDEPPDARATFDRIAAHFDETRHRPWPEVEAFVGEYGSGSVGLDLGCGNGRHTLVLARAVRYAVGIDLSRELLVRARRRTTSATPVEGGTVDLVQGDARAIPVDDDRIDLALYVATIHHIPEPGARLRSLDELARVLSTAGHGLVSAWSTAHDRFDEPTGFDTTIDWTLPNGETVPRYYHIYDPDEFQDVLSMSRLTVVESFVSSGNCYAVVRSE